MKNLFLLALIVALVCGLAGAQNHVNGYAGSSSSGNVYIWDGANLQTVTAGTSTGYGLVMDRNNRLLLALNLNGTLYQIDPATQTVVGNAATGITSPRDIAVDQNGDYFFTTSTTLYKMDPTNTVTQILTGQSTIYGGMDVDIDTGDLLVQSRSTPDPLLLISRDGATVATKASGGDPRYGITQHIPTGDIYTGSCCGDFTPPENVFVYPGGGPTAMVWLSSANPPVGVYSLKADRASAAQQRLILGGFGASSTRGDGGFFTADIPSKTVALVSKLTVSLYETEILYRRNLHSNNTGTGKWDIGIKVPEDPGLAYVLGISALGVRPGIALPDGRTINLAPDTLTFAGLLTGLAPFLTGERGTLDANGEAIAKLDLSSIGSAANGIRLYFEVLTFAPAAPLGIKTITDPHVIKIEGL